MLKTIEIDDSLEERIEEAIENLLTEYTDYICDDDNKCQAVPEVRWGPFHYHLGFAVSEALPTKQKEIDGLWYLHREKLEKAYDDFSLEDNPMANDGQMAIRYYMEDRVMDWYDENKDKVLKKMLDSALKWEQENS